MVKRLTAVGGGSRDGSGSGAAPALDGTSLAVLAVAGAVLLVQLLRLYDPFLFVDDAFISFRYARNLAEGLGLVFNPGERVEGYTNFLWTVLLALAWRLGLDLRTAALGLSLLAALGSIVVLERWGRRLFAGTSHGWLLGGLPALVFAAMPSQARYVVSGMETLLFVFLVLWASYLLLARERAVAAGVVFALATMTRPEGGLYWLVATAIAVLRPAVAGRLRPAAAALGAFVVVYAPYFLWRYGYYDQLLPNTFYAKAAEPSWERVARGLRQLERLTSSWSLLPPLLLALPSLGGLSRRTVGFAWASIGATLAYFLYVGGDVLSFFGPRFLMPALPGLLLLAAVGVERFTVLLPRVRWRLAALVLAALALVGNALVYSWPADPSLLDDLRVEGEAQTRLAEWMLEHTPPGTVFATPAAGIVPFLTGRPTIDMYGLNDAHIAHRPVPPGPAGKAGHEKHDARYVLDRRPDLVLTSLSRRGLPHSAGLREVAARFRACYELIALVRVQKGPPGDGRWVVPVTDFVPQLWQAGYSDGLFRRRTGEACRGEGS